jgi:dihydroneopterin aldolase
MGIMQIEVNTLGTLGFERLRIRCIIGVLPIERQVEQDIYVDLKAIVDMSQAVLSDQLSDTVDYIAMATMCRDIAIAERFYLLEKYAAEVLKAICKRFPIKEARIIVRKPAAHPDADCTFVEMQTVSQKN